MTGKAPHLRRLWLGWRHINRNKRTTCLCGSRRLAIPDHVWQVSNKENDPITPKYYYRCPACSSYSAINIHYPAAKYEDYFRSTEVEEPRRRLNADRVSFIKQRLPQPIEEIRQIVDLGAGEGACTHALADGFPDALVTAVEAEGRYEARFYEERRNVRFEAAWIDTFLEETDSRERFDMAVLTDVFEHLIWPEATLARIATALKPGGLLYFTAPNARTFDDSRFPFAVSAGSVDWPHAARTCQHLFMATPAIMEHLLRVHFDIIVHSEEFETSLRRDSIYSTVLARRHQQ